MSTFLSLALLIILAAAPAARAQSAPTLVGGGVGGALGIESASVPVYAGSEDCGVFESGSAAVGSVDARLVLPALIAPSAGIDVRLRLSFVGAALSATPPVATTVRDPDGGALVDVDRELRLERTTIVASIDLLARASFDRFVLSAGVSLGDRLTSTVEQSDNILGPGAISFPDGQTARAMPATTSETAPIAIAPMIAAGYALPLGAGAAIVPEIAARFDLLSSVKDASWRSIEIGVGVGILFDLAAPASPIAPGSGR